MDPNGVSCGQNENELFKIKSRLDKNSFRRPSRTFLEGAVLGCFGFSFDPGWLGVYSG